MLKKTAWLVIGQGLSDGLAFVFYISLARHFGDEGIGDYSFAFALAIFVGTGIEFGLRGLITRNITREPTLVDRYVGAVLMIQPTLIMFGGLVLHIFLITQAYSHEMYVLLVCAFVSVALKALGVSFAAFLESAEAMHKSAMLEVFARVAIVAIGFSFIYGGADLELIMLAHIAGSGLYLAMAAYWMRQDFKDATIKVDLPFIKKTVQDAAPFFFVDSLWQIYVTVDIVMLHSFVGSEATGQYAVATRFVRTPLVAAFLIGIAMYPRLSKASAADANEQKRIFLLALKWCALVGSVGAVLLVCSGDFVIRLLFGDQFAISGDLTRWMAPLLFLGFVKVPYERLLLAANLERTKLHLHLMSIASNVALNAMLIPMWQVYGALWASVVSDLFLVALFHLYCARIVSAQYVSKAARLFVAGVAAVIVGTLMRSLVQWPLIISSALIALVISFVVLRIITMADCRHLLVAFPKGAEKV